MSRVAKKELHIPSGVSFTCNEGVLNFKGPMGTLEYALHPDVEVQHNGNVLTVHMKKSQLNRSLSQQQAGTANACIANIIKGVSAGCEKRLTLIGVGYKAQVQGSKLNLSLGFSHPVIYEVPKGISVETPTQTEIVIKGSNKVLVGQVAATIRAYRPPEPYKGKGVRYADEVVVLKETKKK